MPILIKIKNAIVAFFIKSKLRLEHKIFILKVNKEIASLKNQNQRLTQELGEKTYLAWLNSDDSEAELLSLCREIKVNAEKIAKAKRDKQEISMEFEKRIGNAEERYQGK